MIKIDYQINHSSLQEAIEEKYFDRDAINFGSFWGDRIFIIDNDDLSFYERDNRDGPVTWFIAGMWNALNVIKNESGSYIYTDNHGCGKMSFSRYENDTLEIVSSLSSYLVDESTNSWEFKTYRVSIIEFEHEIIKVQKKFVSEICNQVPYFQTNEMKKFLEDLLEDK